MEEVKSNAAGKIVKLRQATINRLDELRHPGQTYDGVITELLQGFKKNGQSDNGKPIAQQKGYTYAKNSY